MSRREQSLGLFHALGKVLFNKRESVLLPSRFNELKETVLIGIGDDVAENEADPDIAMTEHELLPVHLERFERRTFENDVEVRFPHDRPLSCSGVSCADPVGNNSCGYVNLCFVASPEHLAVLHRYRPNGRVYGGSVPGGHHEGIRRSGASGVNRQCKDR